MKIITVNLPEEDIKTIKSLVGENGLYPSRSELIRVAIRDFLVKKLNITKTYPNFKEDSSKLWDNNLSLAKKDSEDYIRIPTERTVISSDGSENTIREYKTYRIIHK